MAYKRKTENIDRERKKKKHNKITINGERLSDGITAH
jgi:hypothetical protein